MRGIWIVGALLVPALVSGCSHVTGSKSSKSGQPPACALIARLDEIANTVARADVHDPTAFNATLTKAVHDYVANVQGLLAIAPGNLHSGLSRVEADVQQLRFEAALTDRAELDAYAARTCGRVASPPSTTTVPTTGTTVFGSTTLPATGPTTTTVAGA
jgi:hypothetical protein